MMERQQILIQGMGVAGEREEGGQIILTDMLGSSESFELLLLCGRTLVITGQYQEACQLLEAALKVFGK